VKFKFLALGLSTIMLLALASPIAIAATAVVRDGRNFFRTSRASTNRAVIAATQYCEDESPSGTCEVVHVNRGSGNGAISIAPNGRWAIASGYKSQAEADRASLLDCTNFSNQQCEVVLRYRDNF
jgi:Domain of unknown function (DUF4189)